MLNATHYRDDQGRAVISKSKAHAIILFVSVLLSVGLYNFVAVRLELYHGAKASETTSTSTTQKAIEPIILRVGTDPAWGMMKESKTIKARVTWYSVADSCHYPAKDGGCYSANYPHKIQPGDIACPKAYKFGTKVTIFGATYTCNDRTANWVQDKWVEPTFDIFVATSAEVKGVKFTTVTIN